MGIGYYLMPLVLPGSEYRTPGWFHAWREADLFQSGRDGKPEHHEFRDDCSRMRSPASLT